MAHYNTKCGPAAVDCYGEYREVKKYKRDTTYKRTHCIKGSGSVTSCNAYGYNDYDDFYTIDEGVTELCDRCFNNSSIVSVSLPSTLIKIGNQCFRNSRITSLVLPKSLKSIGHNNFPSTLTSLEIPTHIKEFFVDNVADCDKLQSITVDEGNKYYRVKDGILYNYDMTEILFCPNAKTGKVIIPNTVTLIGNYCFAKCQRLDMVIIPTSVVEIGDYAFPQMYLETSKQL